MDNGLKSIHPAHISFTQDKKPFLVSNEGANNGNYHETSLGLTKREYFAGLAMQGLINNVNSDKHIVAAAIKLADELLEQLETTQK